MIPNEALSSRAGHLDGEEHARQNGRQRAQENRVWSGSEAVSAPPTQAVLKDMKIVLDFSPGYSVQVLGKFVHEPVSFPLAKAQSTAPAEVTLLGPPVFGEGTGSGRDCKCHC